ncbi:MAG: phosphate starvation-inducible protein PhoH [Firmicutes bacterium]|nr:phosphate starvation-inducible protein PhoH [Bacillota bacterium]
MKRLGYFEHYPASKQEGYGREAINLSAILVEEKFAVEDNAVALALFGHRDENLKVLGEQLDVRFVPRGNVIGIRGEKGAVRQARIVLDDLIRVAAERPLTVQDIRYAAQLVEGGKNGQLGRLHDDVVQVTSRGKKITPKTLGQKRYLDAMRQHLIVFGIGPAGTGKTYLAMAMAVRALRNREVARIILTRPAVEAGERLGFLPGDLQEKVDPYLRPLYDALYDILGVEGFRKYVERGAIEVAPLAYMRGRTLDDSFIILDEAQNTTPEQMKMFLTRMGFGSRMVVTGDITQIDLPKGVYSGLQEAREVLQNTEGISIVELDDADVVRHHLVQRIVQAYERFDQDREKREFG